MATAGNKTNNLKKPSKNLRLLVQLETIINSLKLLVSVHIYPGQIGDTYPKR